MLDLSFGGTQIAVAVAFTIVALALGLFFLYAGRQANREIPLDDVKEAAYKARPFWLAFLVVLLGGIVAVTLFFTPFHGNSAAADATTVKVVGGQFYWSITPESVPVGTEVTFEVTGADVNHGFGLYNPDGEMVATVQAMPDFVNNLTVTMDEPGTYVISCLEYCGIKHHDMMREFKVTEE